MSLALAYAAYMRAARTSRKSPARLFARGRLACALLAAFLFSTVKPVFAASPVAALVQQGGAEEQKVRDLEQKLGQARAIQQSREKRAALMAQEIEKLKGQPPSVTRDLALGERLAQAQTQANELAQDAAAQRRLAKELGQSRQHLVHTCDAILDAKDAPLTSAQRFTWLRLRTAQVEALLGDSDGSKTEALLRSELAAGSDNANSLDDPQALRERADLLRDSADKLRREAERLSAHSEELKRRQKLRERASRVDEDLFAEQSTARRSISTGAARTGTGGTGALADAAAPAPAAAGAATPVSPPIQFTSPSAHGAPDPATLDGLLRVEGPGDPAQKLAALSRAQAELSALAEALLRRASRLDSRAATLRQQK